MARIPKTDIGHLRSTKYPRGKSKARKTYCYYYAMGYRGRFSSILICRIKYMPHLLLTHLFAIKQPMIYNPLSLGSTNVAVPSRQVHRVQRANAEQAE